MTFLTKLVVGGGGHPVEPLVGEGGRTMRRVVVRLRPRQFRRHSMHRQTHPIRLGNADIRLWDRFGGPRAQALVTPAAAPRSLNPVPPDPPPLLPAALPRVMFDHGPPTPPRFQMAAPRRGGDP